MTVTVETVSDTATADGVLTSFPFTFELLQAADLDVYIDDVLTAFGYIVEINENGTGGDVIFDDPPEDGAELLFLRNVDITQETALPVEGNLPESTLETMADKLTMICQELKILTDRALKVPLNILGTFTSPLPEALNLIRWNAGETSLENVDPATIFNEFNPGAGNVLGPVSSTARTIALWNSADGQLLKAGPAIGSSGQVLTSNGAGVDPSFQDATSTAAKLKTADESVTSSTTIQADDHLVQAVAADETWHFTVNVFAISTSSTPDIKFTMNGPSGATVKWFYTFLDDGGGFGGNPTAANNGGDAITLAMSANLGRHIRITGYCANGATPGNIGFAWAQNTSDATATVVKQGSTAVFIRQSA